MISITGIMDHQPIEGIAALLIAGILVTAALTDLAQRRIPNALPLALVGVFSLLTAARLVQGADYIQVVLMPLLTAFAVLSVGTLLFTRGALGGGDVKLLTALALYASAPSILAVLMLMALSGGVLALLVLVLNRVGALSDQRVPYGVAIAVAGLGLCAQPVLSLTI